MNDFLETDLSWLGEVKFSEPEKNQTRSVIAAKGDIGVFDYSDTDWSELFSNIESCLKIRLGHSAETRAKIGAAHLGKVVSEVTRAKLSASNQARIAAGYKPPLVTDEIIKLRKATRAERYPDGFKMPAEIVLANAARKRGSKHSEDSRVTMRAAQQARLEAERLAGIKRSPTKETRDKISAALLGNKQSEETKAKKSASCTGRVHSDEVKRKISIGNMGKVVSDEARENMRAAQQRRIESGYVPPPVTEEIRAKIGAVHKGKVMSEETRAKLRAANLGKKLGPRSPETVERMKLAAKDRWAKRKAEKALANVG